LKRLKGAGGVAPKKNADLKARTLSAIVMVAVAGSALWLGGLPWMVFVLLVGRLWEWNKLSRAIAASWWARLIWIAGVVYVGVAAEMLITLRALYNHPIVIVMLFVGGHRDRHRRLFCRSRFRAQIAPKISPSKTWSGLFGGILGATLVFYVLLGGYKIGLVSGFMGCLQAGALIAIIAQTGDFSKAG
jgi:phosphatidate cytidylyltransferase